MKRLIETQGKAEKSLGDGIYEIRVIQAGWGSSGYYDAEMLKEYGPQTFRAGRLSFANHSSDEEYENGRDLTKIMAKLVTDAEWREDEQALFAQIKVDEKWRSFVEEYKDSIGMSIFASGESVEGEVDGRKGHIVESFDPDFPYTSVDFVVAAGAGGKIERMIESFNAVEALDSDRRSQLNALVKDIHGQDNTWVWVRDYDESTNTVYFDVDGNDSFATYSQKYSLNDDIAISLDGDAVKVHTKTSYIPVGVSVEENTKEKEMKPEELEQIATSVAAAVVEALKPTANTTEEDAAPSAADIAEAVVAANLPESARKRVFEILEHNPQADIAKVIESEKAYAESLLEEASKSVSESDGRVRVVTESVDRDFTVGGW